MNAFTRQAFWFEVPYWDELPVIGVTFPSLKRLISLSMFYYLSLLLSLSLMAAIPMKKTIYLRGSGNVEN